MKETLNIALIQSHLYWESPEDNRKMFEEKIIKDKQPDVEMGLTVAKSK